MYLSWRWAWPTLNMLETTVVRSCRNLIVLQAKWRRSVEVVKSLRSKYNRSESVANARNNSERLIYDITATLLRLHYDNHILPSTQQRLNYDYTTLILRCLSPYHDSSTLMASSSSWSYDHTTAILSSQHAQANCHCLIKYIKALQVLFVCM